MAKDARPQKPPVTPLKDGQSVIQQIGLFHERMIGRLVAEWSHLESAVELFIWELFELEMSFGRIITTKMDISSRLQMLRLLIELGLPDEFKISIGETISKIDVIREDRNFIIHGGWFTIIPDGIPLAFSLRPKHDPTQIVGETFDRIRMRATIKAISGLRREMVAHINALSEKRTQSPSQLYRDQSNHPPNPGGQDG